jgi:hypothetical protein
MLVPTSGPAQATPTDDSNFVAAASAMPVNENPSGTETGSWSSDGGEFGSPFSWTEESSAEDLDYFAVLDVAASPCRGWKRVERLSPRRRRGPGSPAGEGWWRSIVLVVHREVIGVVGWGWNEPALD